jgi:SAM-dependent methyltransferase
MSELPSLPLTMNWHQEMAVLSEHIRQRANIGAPIQILEAGCGQKWDLNLAGTPYVLTGVDVDKAALDLRMNVAKDLDESIVGDLRTVQLADGAYDVIYCSYVLEHVPGAEGVLRNFVRWLKPSGILAIQIPDPFSVKGFVTRVTPHWFHIFFYRQVMGFKDAGKPGHAPYPTYYDAVVSRRGMREFCKRHGLTIKAEFGCGGRSHGRGVTRLSVATIQWMINIFSFGALSARHDDLIFIIQIEPLT